MSLILLAGGKSSRFNTDKAFLEFKNKFLIETIIDKLINLFDEIIIVANDDIKKYNKIINKKIIIKKDLIKNKGPLGGIYTGLKTSKEKKNFVVACDMPFVNVDLVKYMLEFDEYDLVIPRYNRFIEPLHAVYSKNNLKIIKNQIKNNDLKMLNFIEKIKKIKYIDEKMINKFDKLCFFNINNENDLEKAKKLIKKYRTINS